MIYLNNNQEEDGNFLKNLIKIIAIVVLVAAFIWVANFASWLIRYTSHLPTYEELLKYNPSLTTKIYGINGQVLNTYSLENRTYIPIGKIPEGVKNAFISAEDKNFYRHNGIDVAMIFRAIFFNVINYVTGQGNLSGASTITQQVVKNLVLTNEKTFSRKLKEAIISVRISKQIPKDKILELYLNHIYLGKGTYGIAAAAQKYFNKSVGELEIHEIATLASLPKAPSAFDPVTKKARLFYRRNWVISQMLAAGLITDVQATLYSAKELDTIFNRKQNLNLDDGFRMFSSQVKTKLAQNYGYNAVFTGGMFVQTTLDENIQQLAHKNLQGTIERYTKKYGYLGAIQKIDLISSQDKDNWCNKLGKVNDINDGQSKFDLALVLGVNQETQDLIVGNKTCHLGTIKFDQLKWVFGNTNIKSNTQLPVKIGDVVAVTLIQKMQSSPQQFIESLKGYTIDHQIIQNFDDMLQRFLKNNDNNYEYFNYSLEQVPKVNGAVLIMEADTGRVVAMSGGYFDNENDFNRATQAKRQPGSVAKPFTYLAALENGYSPASPIIDADIEFGNGSGDTWAPKNSTDKSYGIVSLRYALERSLNIPTVRLAEMVGIRRVAEVFKRLGVTDKTYSDLSTVLGTKETTLMDMVRGYGIIANGGFDVKPYIVDYVLDKNGKTIYSKYQIEHNIVESSNNHKTGDEFEISKELQDIIGEIDYSNEAYLKKRLVSEDVAFQLKQILHGATIRGTSAAVNRYFKDYGFDIGGKTGTTDNSKDSWFIGFTNKYVVGVYIGFDKPQSLGKNEYGATLALPVFINTLKGMASLNYPMGGRFEQPTDIKTQTVVYKTGRKPSSNTTQGIITEYFKEGDKPLQESIDGSEIFELGISGTPLQITPEEAEKKKVIKAKPEPKDSFFDINSVVY